MRYIKYISLIMVLICGLSFTGSAYAATVANESPSLSIDQALKKANKNNPSLRTAELSEEQAEIAKDDLAEIVEYIPGAGLVSPDVQKVVNSYQVAEISWNKSVKAKKAAQEQVTKEVVSTYIDALKAYNSMERAKISLLEADDQLKMKSLAQAVGTLSDFDYEKAKLSNQQQEEEYKSLQAQYDSSIASLRSLLGANDDWYPTLSSKAILSQYKCDELSLELSRGLSNSVAVWQAEAEMEKERSSEGWIIQGTTSEDQAINSGMAEANYEQAKRDSRSQIEQLYYTIDSLQGQIAAAEQAYNTAKKESDLAELKYQLGLIPQSSMSGGESRSSLTRSVETSRLSLENLKASLVSSKASFAYLTGKTIYDAADWSEN